MEGVGESDTIRAYTEACPRQVGLQAELLTQFMLLSFSTSLSSPNELCAHL